MSRTDKIGLAIFLGTLSTIVAMAVLLIVHDISNNHKSNEYGACVQATNNIDGCEKEIYPERFSERQKKEVYYRKRVQVK